MGLNNTPMAERIHIGIFGRRNAGKSSIINAMTGQNLAIVSDVAGTTTDPVLKAMELLPLGPVVIIDTPGLDDEGELGKLRVQKAYQVLNKTDIAVVVIDGSVGRTAADAAILERIREKNIPYIIVKNKSDLQAAEQDEENEISVSAKTGQNIYELKERITALVPKEDMTRKIVGDLLEPNDLAVLVVPIDSAAPKGRLILPQQQTIRDILEAGAVSVVTRDHELKETLASIGRKPRLVITDSQIFGRVSKEVPADIQLTSFSILMARYKGDLEPNVKGARALEQLQDGDTVLISEGCTHHRQCEDIGTVKLPRWIREHTGKDLQFAFTSGTEFPLDLSPYKLIVHCGGCMLNEREMKYRLKCAEDQGIPMTNYGICIAYINGILERSLAPFGI
ncbi:MAG: [FeFe] hydrogenase H-cluster maturation GTPase HydF [Bacteroidales bacterium]|nr:[FeFe] hydrogenase H-cluster maturation GTPase HydF [Anaerotignum sp.]MCI5679795.1 [FeFe] hydrogenase H-cluster maturation GTPase HydF [Bacteroidales bacterium]MDY3926303.1 [FeFe] hydrogenase H-cluster maturation GTPase HydF [Anaerotignum sp.]